MELTLTTCGSTYGFNSRTSTSQSFSRPSPTSTLYPRAFYQKTYSQSVHTLLPAGDRKILFDGKEIEVQTITPFLTTVV